MVGDLIGFLYNFNNIGWVREMVTYYLNEVIMFARLVELLQNGSQFLGNLVTNLNGCLITMKITGMESRI